jgi:hypothetical protein
MTPKDILGIIVRAMGLFIIFYGAYNGLFAAAEAVGLLPAAQLPASHHAVGTVLLLVLGLVVVRNADRLVELAYKKE